MPPQIRSRTQSAHLIPDLVVQGASTSPPLRCALVCANEWTLGRLPVRSGTRPIRLLSILEFFPIMTLTLPKATLEVNSAGVMTEGLSGGRHTSQALGWRFPVRFRTNASCISAGYFYDFHLCCSQVGYFLRRATITLIYQDYSPLPGYVLIPML